LPNEIEGKDMKKLLKEYFHPDGKSKKKQEDFVTDEQLQEWNAVGMFAIKVVGQRMRVAQSKEYKEQRKQEAKERKEANRERHQLARGGRSVEES
jgi:hypothetical protein